MWRRAGLATIAAVLALASATAPSRPNALPQVNNSAQSAFQLPGGAASSTQSNDTNAAQVAFSALLVTPKETAPLLPAENQAIGSNATRLFTITNTSDIADAYTVSAAASSQRIVSIAFVNGGTQIPVTSAATASPLVAPGGTIAVSVVVSTSGMAVGQSLPVVLTAKTTVAGTSNGTQTDTGKQFIVASPTTTISGPAGPNTQVMKTVNQTSSVQSKPGAGVSFDIVAKNSGNAPATNVIVNDAVPAGLAPAPGSATIDGRPAGSQATFNGQQVSFAVPLLAVGAQVDVGFSATVAANVTLGNTYVNVATVSADGISPQNTTPASVLDGDANIVFDGAQGGAAPISGAAVTLLDASGIPVRLSGTSPYASNPVVTAANGAYGFALSASQIGATGSPFAITIQAAGYRDRKIGLTIVPDPLNPSLYDVTATAIDGQPLAKAGGFSLTGTAVTLSDVFGLFGNLPLFKTAGIVVSKSANRTVVSPGDRLDFTVSYTNATLAAVTPAAIVDTLPPGLEYAPGTASIDGRKSEPAVNGRALTWSLPSLAPGATGVLTYSTVVFAGVSPGSQLTNTATVSGPSNGASTGGTGSFSFTVQAGPFADRRVLTGRVFADVAGTGHYQRGDLPVAGARVYAEDGSFATTDRDGKFSFPSLRPGMHALRLDATTLPAGFRAYAQHRMNSTRSSMQLVHGILDTTTMEDVEFAVEAVP